jgi:hypothetical protein
VKRFSLRQLRSLKEKQRPAPCGSAGIVIFSERSTAFLRSTIILTSLDRVRRREHDRQESLE